MAYSAFQSNAFQRNAFQVVRKRKDTGGSGSGKKKRRQGYNSLEEYKALGQTIADSNRIIIAHEEAQEPIAPKASPHIRPRTAYIPSKSKLGDITEIQKELSKLKFLVSQEILLQDEEDEAIFMLMMANV